MTIVFLVFGENLTYYKQTYLSILSLLRRKRKEDRVLVFAENPRYFLRLNGLVESIEITQEQIKDWSLKIGYYFRCKIKVLEYAAQLYPDSHLLFFDGDVFVVGDLSLFEQKLNEGIGLMHKNEGHPSGMGKKIKRMWNAIKGKTIDGTTISMKHDMWNSGVIGIPRDSRLSVMSKACCICDAILSTGKASFTAEQYSFSIAMNEQLIVEPTDNWVWHYWGNKDGWLDRIDKFIVESHLCNNSIEREIVLTDDIIRESIPVYVDKSDTKRRLIKLINRLFKDKIPTDNNSQSYS